MKIITAIFTFIIFLVFACSLQTNWVRQFDNFGMELLKGNRFFEPFHYIGEPIFVIIVALIILLLLAYKMKNYRAIVFTLITIAGGNLINLIAKNIIQRDRPNIPDQLTSYSFPSGHSMTGILYLLTIAYLLSEHRTKGQKIGIYAVSLTLAMCIGFSRIAGMRHYFSDVIGGWSLGITVFMLALYWYEKRKKEHLSNS